MTASPHMPLAVADHLAETFHLTAEELGAYHRLRLHYWQRSKPLPAEPDKLARLAGLSLDRWAEVEPTLSEFFEIRDGLWYHPGIEAELAKAATKSEKARQAGRLSWKSRRGTTAQRTLSKRYKVLKNLGFLALPWILVLLVLVPCQIHIDGFGDK